MKKNVLKTLTLAAVLALPVTAYAQTDGSEGETTGTNAPAEATDSATDWGWLGLAGILGLAGLGGKRYTQTVVNTSNTTRR
ncbi:hypothetical protein L1280_000580 [Deinococcus sp. HSC-46F16]|uniref:WGxxGxxG family protein n=1 Tax=unclassified Deinococcus TaxID=2623546 RepID=UPI000CF54A7F|nr:MULTISPECIES: WGxxGxxG family protein [unclassified Deinococcus]MCP2013452.1 hypothetical protein [Deinococcus sp. HSC-46F16]